MCAAAAAGEVEDRAVAQAQARSAPARVQPGGAQAHARIPFQHGLLEAQLLAHDLALGVGPGEELGPVLPLKPADAVVLLQIAADLAQALRQAPERGRL